MILVSFHDFSTNKKFEKEFNNSHNLTVFLQRVYYGDSKLFPHNYSFRDLSDSSIYIISDNIDYWRSRIKMKLIKAKVFDLDKLYG